LGEGREEGKKEDRTKERLKIEKIEKKGKRGRAERRVKKEAVTKEITWLMHVAKGGKKHQLRKDHHVIREVSLRKNTL
jgi:hypothetical protein